MSRATSDPGSLEAWPEEPENGANGQGNGSSKRGRRNQAAARPASTRTTTMTAKTAPPSLREYSHYKELFYNLTLRDLRSKYKRSVIGWGWSMINPLANMLIYTIVFSVLLHINPPGGHT